MDSPTDKQIKEQFESVRNQRTFAIVGIVFVVVILAGLAVLTFDPFRWFVGTPAIVWAKKQIVMAVCGIILPCLAGIWFLVIKPLRTGIAAGGSKYRAPYIVLRSENPSKFRAEIWWNKILITAGLAIGICVLVDGIRELHKLETETPAKPIGSVTVKNFVCDSFRVFRG